MSQVCLMRKNSKAYLVYQSRRKLNNRINLKGKKMDKSESIKELASALAKAQGEFAGAVKDTSNPFFKSKYADLESCVSAIKSPLAKHGLSFVQVSHNQENSATIETIIMHSSGEWLSAGLVAVPVTKADAQGFGSAMTYARRYSLSAAFGIAPEDDDGNAAAKAKPDSTTKATVDVSFKPDADQVTFMLSVVDAIIDNQADISKCVELFYQSKLDNDEKLWIWEKLQPYSSLRSAMKKLHDSNKVKETA